MNTKLSLLKSFYTTLVVFGELEIEMKVRLSQNKEIRRSSLKTGTFMVHLFDETRVSILQKSQEYRPEM